MLIPGQDKASPHALQLYDSVGLDGPSSISSRGDCPSSRRDPSPVSFRDPYPSVSLLDPNPASLRDSSPPGLSPSFSTYVPVVSLEYTLPGPVKNGRRIPPPKQPPQVSQSLVFGRPRLPRHNNVRAARHLRNTLLGPLFDSHAEHQIQGIGLHRNDPLLKANGDIFSSSTPSVPFPSGDLHYGNGEGSGVQGAGVRGHVEEVAVGDLGSWDPRTAEKKLKELDLHGNKRPTSRNSLSRKVANCDKVPFDREREELRPIANSLPTKQSPLRANGLKNNLLRADQILTQRANGSAGRDEDLVAMGTLWSPGQLQTRGSSTGTSSGKSTSGPSGPQSNAFSATGTLPVRRPINLSTSTSTRQLLHQNSTSSSLTGQSGGMGNIVRCSTKEVEPKYSDPLSGAPASFQQRLMELAALEAETVRWERSKKVKKKAPKQDRDS